MPEKIIRDSVHDVIAFRMERPADALLFRLLNAAEVQRLRRVRQLGMASLAYPAAEHSRYSHCLGVMETARKMLAQLRFSTTIDDEEELVCVSAALLHDLGHGPLSHVFERVSGIEHEKLTRRILLDGESDVHQILASCDASLPMQVADMLQSGGDRPFFHDVLSSELDADRLDYLLRDNLMTGSKYGNYDLQWLIHSLTVDEPSGRLAVTWKGVSAVEAYLQSRYHMYRNVYFHKVVRAAEGMVKLALQRAKRLMVQDRLSWPPRDHSVHKALTGQHVTVDEYIDLDDYSVMHCLKLWKKCDDVALAALCRGLLDRKLFKTIDLSHLDESEALTVFERAREAVIAAGGDGSYDLFYDEPKEEPADPFSNEAESGVGGEIMVRNYDGRLMPFATLSPLSQAMSRQLKFRRIHVAASWRELAYPALP